MPRNGHLEWQVPYAPGKLEAEGYNGHKVVATDTVETTGAPTQIRLIADRTTLKADGEDLIPVTVQILDDKGRVVPYADNEVTFAITGSGHVAGVGNGDPSSHEPDRASKRHAFHGLCLVNVQSDETPGAIELTATAPNFKPARLTLRVKR